MFKFFAVFALSTAAICAVGCKKAPDQASVTHTTSAELDVTPPSNSLADTVTAPNTNDYLSTVRREQISLKARLDDAMSATDRQLSDLRRGGKINSPEAHDLIARRQTLEADSQVVARSDERGWDELKATVEHDLEE